MTTSKIATYTTVADFEAVAKRIANGIGNAKRLMQQATIAAMEHLQAHGNVNVFAPLDKAGTSFTKAQHNLWRKYVQHFTWLRYNADNKNGKALKEAAFDKLWTKDKAGKMDIDAAREVDWFTWSPDDAKDQPEIDLADYVKSVEKRIKKLLADKKLYTKEAPNGAITKRNARVADVRKEMLAMLTVLTDIHHEPIVADGKATPEASGDAVREKPVVSRKRDVKGSAPKGERLLDMIA